MVELRDRAGPEAVPRRKPPQDGVAQTLSSALPLKEILGRKDKISVNLPH
jgi:hypothetical protein